MQELARYWSTDYDWHNCEAQLNIRRNRGSSGAVDVHMAKRCRRSRARCT